MLMLMNLGFKDFGTTSTENGDACWLESVFYGSRLSNIICMDFCGDA